ncbi:probable inactive peptidyl-prolyl cis-trans isomerase-like 6 isoform X1 [Nerophis lumbriciformis]|uniref:probable inactive peptidyl-prolyl cis-trans isomerase-like 6 isoform X1 n=1 Tax=Nerophis lumbriciformis TaxID=546530 RepID=UPI002AE01E10|nr:probable inactive peptidyl-prolyl cis-trans isomerase-like 6 isoform X1 [Nerophis lumbriciformis]
MACLPADSIDPKPYIEIVGLIKEPHFYVAKSITQGLIQKFPRKFVEPTIRPLLEFDWHAYLCNQKRELRGVVWEFSSSVMCFLDGNFIGDEGALATWAENQWGFTCTPPQASCVKEHYLKHLQSSGHRFVFMDVEIGGEPVGTLLFELFSDVCPKTSMNFEALCTGERGLSTSGYPLCYKGSLFHRVVPKGWVQGGDRGSTVLIRLKTPGLDTRRRREGIGRNQCKTEIFPQVVEEMEGSPSMDQPLKMRALLILTQSGQFSEWPIRAPTAMAPSSTSPCSQRYGWTEHTFLLVKWLRVWMSSRD